MSQPVLPLLPAGAVPVGPVAGLVEDADGGVVYVSGLATYAYAAGDEAGRRLAAAQLVEVKIASVGEVTAGFGVEQATLWRWRQALGSGGVAGLVSAKRGPKGPSKLTDEVIARCRELDVKGWSLRRIAAEVEVSTATVRVALGRRAGSAGFEAGKAAAAAQEVPAQAGETDPATADADTGGGDTGDEPDTDGAGAVDEPTDSVGAHVGDTIADSDADSGAVDWLPVLPAPVPRTAERGLARWGLLDQAPVVFTEGARLPLAGLLLILPALGVTGLLGVFDKTYGRLRNGFYGLRATVLMLVFLALLRDPRAEGATRINPADLGRLLGLDRAPEVKTLRRKLTELAGCGQGATLQAELAKAHAAARPEALGFLLVDGHVRAYFGKRDLPKTHVARLHMKARATVETWVADADGDPVMVITALPSASLAAELVRLLPELRAVIGPGRPATIIFDRGGWSPKTFAAIVDAGFDLITYRKGEFDPLANSAFTEARFTDPDSGVEHVYTLGETTTSFDLPKGRTLQLRQIHKRTGDGDQIPIVTSRDDLGAAEVCWRLGGRWRQENYFKYGRAHFALDALDSYADIADDPDRPVPNPAKHHTKAAVNTAKATLADAEAGLCAAIDEAGERAGRPGSGGTAEVDPAAVDAVDTARNQLDEAKSDSRDTPGHLPLRAVRPDARLLNPERKLITHAIRMAAYNAETTLARILRPHYARADDEARALLREAITLSGDLHVDGDTLHIRLDPASAPRRSRALHALCHDLTATQTRYPGTNHTIHYSVKNHPDPA